MSGGKEKGPGHYDVGYGKTPKHTRFAPGKSGNPKGRPKRAFGKHHLPAVILERAREVFIEEGDRPMTIRDGDGVVALTSYRVAVRGAHVAAAKGSAMAMRTVIQERLRIEREMSETMRALFQQMVTYKEDWARERLRCAQMGRPQPIFPIDPDHVVLDWEGLTVRYGGPLAELVTGNLRQRLRRRDEWVDDFEFCRRCYDESPHSAGALIMVLQSQRNYDLVNESLPPAHRMPLAARICYTELGEALARLRSTGAKPQTGGSGP